MNSLFSFIHQFSNSFRWNSYQEPFYGLAKYKLAHILIAQFSYSLIRVKGNLVEQSSYTQ